MSYNNGLLLRNILSKKDSEKLINFCESRKFTLYPDENIRVIFFTDYNIAKKMETTLRKKGLWDENAHSLKGEMYLYNYWDLLPGFNDSKQIRKIYTKTRTFLDTTGREVQIMLDKGTSEKYILSTKFIHRKRIVEAPSKNQVLLTCKGNWEYLC